MENTGQYLNNLKAINSTKAKINDYLNSLDYETVETTYFEGYDDFLKIRGRIQKEKTVKVINALGEIEILRPDVTLNIMKKIAPFYEGELLKLKYDSTIFENTSYSINEKNIMGAEIFGSDIKGDMEILRVVLKLMDDTRDSMIVLGHTKYLSGLLKQIPGDKREEVRELVYKKQSKILWELLNTLDIPAGVKEKFSMILDNETYPLDAYRKNFMNRDMELAINEIEVLKKLLNRKAEVDFGLVSKFDYYDGMFFKVFNKQLSSPIIRGGRYDKLSRLFKKQIPAVGFSIDFNDYRKVVKNENSIG